VQVPIPIDGTGIPAANLLYSSASVSVAGPSSIATLSGSHAQAPPQSGASNPVSGNSRNVEVTGRGVQGAFKPTVPKRRIGQPGYYYYPYKLQSSYIRTDNTPSNEVREKNSSKNGRRHRHRPDQQTDRHTSSYEGTANAHPYAHARDHHAHPSTSRSNRHRHSGKT